MSGLGVAEKPAPVAVHVSAAVPPVTLKLSGVELLGVPSAKAGSVTAPGAVTAVTTVAGLLPVRLTMNEPAPVAVAFGVVQVSVAVRAAPFASVGVKRIGNVVFAPAAIDTGNIGAGLKLNSAALVPPNVQPERFNAAVLPALAVTVVDCVAVGVPTAVPVKVNASGVAV
mgnify:CR=1 FL=1